MQGNQIVARALAQQDLKICFGIVGVSSLDIFPSDDM
jgi:thiamine pyrophosphate-dependent acetolactate synthase large subunit-like protein